MLASSSIRIAVVSLLPLASKIGPPVSELGRVALAFSRAYILRKSLAVLSYVSVR